MLRWAIIIISTLGFSSIHAAEQFRVVLTDVEQNIYKETIKLTSSDITPARPTSWSIRKHILHGGKQEGVEVIEVDNGNLQFSIPRG